MNTSKQLKDLINNKAKQYNLNPQILLTRFFMTYVKNTRGFSHEKFKCV